MAIGVQHSRELLWLGPADSVGDQKGADLSGRCFPLKHQFERISCFLPAHPFAGVLTTAHLAQVLFETLSAGRNSARHGIRRQVCAVFKRVWPAGGNNCYRCSKLAKLIKPQKAAVLRMVGMVATISIVETFEHQIGFKPSSITLLTLKE